MFIETITKEEENFTISPRVAAVILDDYIARREDKISIAGLVIGLTFVAAFLSIVIGLLGKFLGHTLSRGGLSMFLPPPPLLSEYVKSSD